MAHIMRVLRPFIWNYSNVKITGSARMGLVDFVIIYCFNTKVMAALLQHFPTLSAHLKVGFLACLLFVLQLTSLVVLKSEEKRNSSDSRGRLMVKFSWLVDPCLPLVSLFLSL